MSLKEYARAELSQSSANGDLGIWYLTEREAPNLHLIAEEDLIRNKRDRRHLLRDSKAAMGGPSPRFHESELQPRQPKRK